MASAALNSEDLHEKRRKSSKLADLDEIVSSHLFNWIADNICTDQQRERYKHSHEVPCC